MRGVVGCYPARTRSAAFALGHRVADAQIEETDLVAREQEPTRGWRAGASDHAAIAFQPTRERIGGIEPRIAARCRWQVVGTTQFGIERAAMSTQVRAG